MQFRIPQFLDIEDRVFGPFTFKQFGYILGAAGFAYIFWKLIPNAILSILFILIFSGTFLALAFVKINTRPFADVLESAYKYALGNKTFVWQKTEIKKEEVSAQTLRQLELQKQIDTKKDQEKIITPDKIRELAGKLDILEEKKETLNLRQQILKKSGKYQI
ncbi:MAG: PrgI family protein [Candidatus Nomurabacteria bacterium]